MNPTTVLAGDAAAAEAPALEVAGLCIDFGVDRAWVPAVRDLGFRVAPGEVMALVGESGSGKSTAAMSILGLLPANARARGSIRLRGNELIGIPDHRMREVRGAKVAAIFQDPMSAMNPVFTIGFQMMETIQLHRGEAPHAARARALELLRTVGLPDVERIFSSYPHQLSGGQKQRAMIAQALSCDPELLIADEPTTALDVTIQAEILDLMHDLKGRVRSAILLITHDMGVVADLADRVLVLRNGRMVESGPVEVLLRSPEEPYTQQLLAAVPRLGGAIETAPRPEAGPSSPSGSEPLLRIENVSVEYTRGRHDVFRAVDDVSMTVADGEVLGIVGESGSGKSTLIKAVAGLEPIVAGRIVLDGLTADRNGVGDRRGWHGRLGMVFQDPTASLNPRRTIGQSIGEPLLLARSLKGRRLDARVGELLDAVSLPGSYKDRYPHELSGGQKQRVGIARALALEPRLLIADEPTSALDVSVQAVVLELLSTLRAELGFASLFISHDLAVINEVADRIAVLRHGVLVECGPTGRIIDDAQAEYTQRLLNAVLDPDPETQQARRRQRREQRQGAD